MRTSRLLDRAYRRLGPRYPSVALAVLLRVEHLNILVGIGVLALYVPVSLGE